MESPGIAMQKLYQLRFGELWTAFWREGLSFKVICFYLFLEYVRPQSAYAVLDVIPWAMVTLLVAMALLFLEKDRVSVSNPENKLIVLFALAILASSAFAYSPQVSFNKIYIFFTWVIIYFLIINIVNTPTRFFIFLGTYFLWNLKMSQHGFTVWVQNGFSFSSWGVGGAPGWFQNSGEFGIEMCMFFPLIAYFTISLWPHWGMLMRLFMMIVAATALGSIVASSSRGALVGIAGVFLWMVLKSKRRMAALAIIAPLAIGLYMLVPEESMQRLQSSGSDYTSQTRLKRWQDGLEILNNHPVLGVGYGNWLKYYRENYPPFEGAEPWGIPHNTFMDAAAELGYVGFAIFALMIVYIFVNNYRTRKIALQSGNTFIYYMGHAMDASMVGFLISGFFISALYYPFIWISMAFTVSLNNVAAMPDVAQQPANVGT